MGFGPFGIEGMNQALQNANVAASAVELAGLGARALLGPGNPADKIAKMDLQLTNKWDFLLSRKLKLSSLVNVATSAAGALADALVTQLYIQSVTIPGVTFEFETASTNKYVKSITYPNEVTMTLIEDEMGLVRRYLTEWERNIAVPDLRPRKFDGANSDSTPVGYIFNDDQDFAKRTGLLLLKSVYPQELKDRLIAAAASFGAGLIGGASGLGSAGAGLASNVARLGARALTGGPLLQYPRIIFLGLAMKNVNEYTVTQENAESLTYTVTFSVDDIRIPLIG